MKGMLFGFETSSKSANQNLEGVSFRMRIINFSSTSNVTGHSVMQKNPQKSKCVNSPRFCFIFYCFRI